MLAAVRLRKLWRQLLMMKLTDTSAQVRDDERHKAEQNALEAKLSRGLVEFVHNTTVFSIKRLLPGDLKVTCILHDIQSMQIFSPEGAICGSRAKHGNSRGEPIGRGFYPIATPYQGRHEVVCKCHSQLCKI